MVRYFLLTLYIAFLLSPPACRSKLPNVGRQGEVAGLSKDAGAAADSFPQVDSMAMQPACHGWHPDGLCTEVSTFHCVLWKQIQR